MSLLKPVCNEEDQDDHDTSYSSCCILPRCCSSMTSSIFTAGFVSRILWQQLHMSIVGDKDGRYPTSCVLSSSYQVAMPVDALASCSALQKVSIYCYGAFHESVRVWHRASFLIPSRNIVKPQVRHTAAKMPANEGGYLYATKLKRQNKCESRKFKVKHKKKIRQTIPV